MTGDAMRPLLLLLIALAVAPAWPQQVVAVADGDSLTVLRDGQPVRVRLAYIDAPEKNQAYGAKAKQSLSALCYRRVATLRMVDVDRYGRTVALVRCDGVDVNRAQVERGLAWAYTRYNPDPALARSEAAARHGRVGLWADSSPVPPWLFRRR